MPYVLESQTPTVEDYCHLRVATGLSPKTPAAARIGLAATLFAVQIRFDGKVIGMGRLVGDGGCHCQICDIAVLPQHQGKGLGQQMLQLLIEAAQTQGYHLLIGGIDAENSASIALHQKLGFVHSGTITQAGFKFGRWLDLAFYQLTLATPLQPHDD